MAAEIFYAEDGEIYICPEGSAVAFEASNYGDAIRTRYQYSDYVTEISVTAGGRDTEQILLFGQTAASQQNSIVRELPQEQYETSITAIMRDYKFNEMVAGTGTTSGGVTTVTGAGTRAQVTIYYRYDDGTTQLEIKFDDAFGVSNEMGSTAEEYLEETTGFKCLAKDYQKKYAADRTVGSIWDWR